jgi:hypothetical protein
MTKEIIGMVMLVITLFSFFMLVNTVIDIRTLSKKMKRRSRYISDSTQSMLNRCDAMMDTLKQMKKEIRG